MKRSTHHTARAAAIGASAVAVCLAGAGFASAHGYGSGYQQMPAHRYGGAARQVAGSGGERFLHAGQTVRLGKVGHFTFTASCMKDESGQNAATFDVTADTTAGLDGNAPAVAGTTVNIHTNSDALDGKDPGAFDQVGSASDSTLAPRTARRSTSSTTTASTGPRSAARRLTTALPATPASSADPGGRSPPLDARRTAALHVAVRPAPRLVAA